MLNVSCKKDAWILYVRIDHPFAIGANKVVIEVMAFIVVDYFLIIYLQHTSFATSTYHKLSYSIFRTLIARIQKDVLLVLIDKARILCRQRSPLILASNQVVNFYLKSSRVYNLMIDYCQIFSHNDLGI